MSLLRLACEPTGWLQRQPQIGAQPVGRCIRSVNGQIEVRLAVGLTVNGP
jgi:hypothetical protein